MKEIIIDTLLDALRILPFLFVAFLIIELFEHRLNKKSKSIFGRIGRFEPVVGGLLGLFPQCGFSVMATNLYLTRIISLGTLISIYLSTSDEMLLILISENVNIDLIIKILGIKFLIGMISGVIIDFVLRNKKKNEDYAICYDESCHCERGILISSLIHTFKIILFIILISFCLNGLIEYVGSDYLSSLFLKNNFFGPFLTSFIGLIPNCGASIIITELYLNSAITFGSMISGLLAGSGVALLVLLKSNKNIKENIKIILLVYGIGSVSGLIIDLLMKLFM